MLTPIYWGYCASLTATNTCIILVYPQRNPGMLVLLFPLYRGEQLELRNNRLLSYIASREFYRTSKTS